jgi:hypothetical protein
MRRAPSTASFVGWVAPVRRRAVAAALLAALLDLAPSAHGQAPLAPLTPPLAGMAKSSTDWTIRAPAQDYTATPHLAAGQWAPPAGWGLFATLSGRSIDLSNHSGWLTNPDAREGEAEVGLGWRGSTTSAVFGYIKPDYGATVERFPHTLQPESLMGINLAVHSR